MHKIAFYTAFVLTICNATVALADDVQVFAGYSEYVDPDSGNQRDGMHTCIDGYGMAGDHLNDNRILCRRLPTLGKETGHYQESNNQEAGMLACQQGYFAVGLHGENTLNCSKYNGIKLGPHFTDTGTQGNNMHVCPPTAGGGAITVMVGMHESNNWRLCAPIVGWKRP